MAKLPSPLSSGEQQSLSFLVRKSHDVALADHFQPWTLNEQRLMSLAVAKLNPTKPETFTAGVRINATEFGEAFGIARTTCYRDLQEAAKLLKTRTINWRGPDHDGDEFWEFIIVGGVKNKRRGQVGFRFNERLLPELMANKSYIEYRLRDVCRFSRAASFRIHELAMRALPFDRRKHTGYQSWTLAELRGKLGCADKYASVNDFMRYVVDKGVAEVNALSRSVHVEVRTVREANRIISLRLVATRKAGAESTALEGKKRIHAKAPEQLSLAG